MEVPLLPLEVHETLPDGFLQTLLIQPLQHLLGCTPLDNEREKNNLVLSVTRTQTFWNENVLLFTGISVFHFLVNMISLESIGRMI